MNLWLIFITAVVVIAGLYWIRDLAHRDYIRRLVAARMALRGAHPDGPWPHEDTWPDWAFEEAIRLNEEGNRLAFVVNPETRAVYEMQRLAGIKRAINSGRHPFAEEP